MPWEVRSVEGKYCTFNKETGRKVACFSSQEKAQAHVKALYANVKNETGDQGLTLLRIAYTNEPHLKLRDHPISVVNIDGKEYVRHPVMVAGKYHHPNGELDLNGTEITDPKHKFNRIIANHFNRVQDAGVYTRPGHTSGRAWTWVSPEHGGWLAYEEDKGDQLLVAYGRPTNPNYVDEIKRGEFQYVSADLHLKYRSNAILENTSPDVVSWHRLSLQEGSMDEVTVKKDEYDALLAKAKLADELQAQLAKSNQTAEETNKKVEQLEARLTETTKKLDPEIPEPVRLMLEENQRQLTEARAEIRKARQTGLVDRFKASVKMATTPDRSGNILDAFTLEFAKNLVFGEPLGKGDELIKLEAQDTDSVREHYIRAMTYFLENAPRSIRSVAQTNGDQMGLESLSGGINETDLKEIDAMISAAWGSYPTQGGK